MWNEAAKPFVESEQLQVLGIIQEQHAERCRLYVQWKQFKFPIAQDSVTALNLDVVPLAMFIDEHGVVRNTRPRGNQLKEFVNTKFDAPKTTGKEESTEAKKVNAKEMAAKKTGAKKLPIKEPNATEHVMHGDDALFWRRTGRSPYEMAIEHYESALRLEPKNAKIMFRLGVAYRARFDSLEGKPEDFDRAVENWSAALRANPNQYIWRRRIEQYGPRQIKPYPFYTWVAQAEKDITERGEKPIELVVKLTESELATNARFASEKDGAVNPDAEGKITVDGSMVNLRTTLVPAKVKAGKTMRVYLRLAPGAAKWNNESAPLQVWINEESDGKTSKRLLEFPNPEKPESAETRTLEFDFQTKKGDSATISGYAVYNICENESAQCVYRRQEFKIEVPLVK